MSELLIWLAMWGLPSALILLWLKADEWIACPAPVDVEPASEAPVLSAVGVSHDELRRRLVDAGGAR